MLAAWREYLRSNGAVPAASDAAPSKAAANEARAAVHGDIIADLCHRAVIAVCGPDARSLLQGQLTNDIEEVNELRTQLSAWCSIKGRVLALFRIWQHGEVHYLELPAELRDTITARLRMYVLRARVSIADGAEDGIRFGVSGPRVAEGLEAEIGPLPDQPDLASRSVGCTVIRLRGDRPRFQVVAPLEQALALWEHCRSFAVPVGSPAWDLLDIRAGIANIPASQSDRFLPQMLHLPAVNALSFTKGCYAGQEIIARTQYLGRLKRRLHRASLHAPEPAAPGDPLYAGSGGRDRQPVGQVINAAPSEHRHRWDLLAVINDEAASAADLRLHHVLGSPLELQPLPYRVDSAAA